MSSNRVVLPGVCMLIGLVAGGQRAQAADAITHHITLPAGMSWCDDAMINGLFTQINTYRNENGLPALRRDEIGMKDAELRAVQFAEYMVSNPPGSPGFNPHQGWDTTAASLGYDIISENLAYMSTDPRNIVYAIWQTPLHRAAMLASDATVAGVSCVYSAGIAYWTYEPGRSQMTPPGNGTDEASKFLTLINEYRAQNGLNPLQVSPTLRKAAEWMSNDMATKNYASHTDSLGRSVGVRLAAFGYSWVPYGENIAGGFPDAQNALNQWKTACDPDASGACTYAHRKAMLSPAFAAIGIGRAFSGSSTYGWYWVTDFGGYVDLTPPAPAPIISSFTANPSTITAGQTATLSWAISGATEVSIDNGIGVVTGLSSKAVTPNQTTTYRLTASNSAGAVSAQVTVSLSAISNGDAQSPSAPALVSATATGATKVALAWSASTDNVGVAGYQVLRNGSPAGTTTPTVLTFTDSVAANTTYTYTIRSYDAAQNYSQPSNALQVKTPALAAPQMCPTPAVNAFTGCYYNNLDMSGAPALIRNDSSINFDWRYTGPSPAVSDSYSVRWQGSFGFAAGTYNFTLEASDGVRLYIDDQLVLDRWRDQPTMWYSVKRSLSAGNHMIRMEYYQRTGTPRAYLGWSGEPAVVTAPVVSSFTATPSVVAAGQHSTLSWAVSGVTSLTIDNGVGDVTGLAAKSVSPLQTTTYRLVAVNSAGQATALVTVQVGGGSGTDLVPPSSPNLTSAVAVTGTAVNLVWTASADNVAVAGYRVSRNGSQIATVSAGSLSYKDATASPESTYTYTVRAFDAAGNQSLASNAVSVTTPAAPDATNCSPAVNAFTGCYFSNIELGGTPTLVRTDNRISFDWTFVRPHTTLPSQYSVRWEGTFTFEEGLHTFYATASDGVRLYIDGALVLDRWRDQPIYTFAVKSYLTAGPHLMTMEYYQRTGTANAGLSWRKD